jgi:hypothetical protein
MKIKATVIIYLIACFAIYADATCKEVKLISEDEEFTVSVYSLSDHLRIKHLYEPRRDLDLYSWLKPLLFQLNCYEMHVPKSEWPKYAEGEWPEERFAAIEKNSARIKKFCAEHSDVCGNDAMYYEISEVVLCKVEDTIYLSFCLLAKKIDGIPQGSSRYQSLKRLGDRWVNALEPEVGRKRSKQLFYCYNEAKKLIEAEQLKALPIAELE